MGKSKKLHASGEIDKSMSANARRAIAYIVLVIICFFCLVWFALLILNATKSNNELKLAFTFKPSNYFIINFKNMLRDQLDIFKGLRNSLIIAASSSVLSVYFSTMTAYAIHAYDFKLKKYIFTFILMIMMIPTQVTTLGFIDLMGDFGLVDTFWPLIIPSIAAPAVFFYLKQYMESALPLSLIEAARIDGSNEFRTFNSIVLPLMKPALAVQAIFAFTSSWNNYFVPTYILESDDKKTLPILIALLRSRDPASLDSGVVYMMIVVAILPVVVIYLILSKHIVAGVALGSVKG